jgi:hypothetical protein
VILPPPEDFSITGTAGMRNPGVVFPGPARGNKKVHPIKSRFFMRTAMSFRALLAGAFVLGAQGCDKVIDQYVPKKPEWKTYSFEELRCSLENPFPFEDMDQDFGNDVKKDILHSRMVQSKVGGQDFFMSFFNAMQCKEGNFDLKEMPGGTIEGLKKMKIYADFQVTTRPVRVSGLAGSLTEGTMRMFWVDRVRIKMLEVTQGHWWWQVLVMYEDNDEREEMAQRIVKSLKISKESPRKEKLKTPDEKP